MGLQDPRQQEGRKMGRSNVPRPVGKKKLAPISKIGSLFVSPPHRIMSLNKNKLKVTLKRASYFIA